MGGTVLGPILSMLGGKPKLKQQQFDLYKPEADYYRARAGELESGLERDRSVSDRAISRFESGLPSAEDAYAKDISFMESTRPGGREENRFSGLINSYMDKARAAASIGLDTARARNKASEAIGGNAPFASSSFRNKQGGLLEANFEKMIADQGSQAQMANALRFLQMFKPGAQMGLSSAMNQYRLSPIAIGQATDAAAAARAGTTTQGLRSAIDTHYSWQKKNNWADYLSALGEGGKNGLEMYMSMYGGMPGGGAKKSPGTSYSPGSQGYNTGSGESIPGVNAGY